MGTRTPEQLRESAIRLRESAMRAQGQTYHDEMQRVGALFREADELEASNKKAKANQNKTDNFRKKDLAKIHLLAKDCPGLDEENAYRDMLERVTGKRSAGKMNRQERYKVIIHLKNAQGVSTTQHYPDRPNSTDSNPQLRKIEALLAEASRPWKYATAMAKHMFNKEKLEFCDKAELSGLISALMKDAKRHGRKTA